MGNCSISAAEPGGFFVELKGQVSGNGINWYGVLDSKCDIKKLGFNLALG